MQMFWSCLALIGCLTAVSAKPEQVHIGPGLDTTSVYISWLDSDYSTTPCVQINENVCCGTQSDYKIATWNSKYITHVQINNLNPDTRYNYKIIGTEYSNYFVTGPALGSTNKPKIKIGVIGDIGQTEDTEQTIKHLAHNPGINLILHAGDLSYADCNQDLWDTYGQMIEPVSSRIPWAVGPGNHEIEYYDNITQVYLSFESRYRMPQIKPAEFGLIQIPSSINPHTSKPYCCPSVFLSEYNYGNSFYSFDYGSAHIIFINPYTPSDNSSPQYKWLESDLINARIKFNSKLVRWIIIVTHCPWYNSNTAHQNEDQTTQMKANLEPLVNKFKVNLIISGHVHAYERTYPVFNGSINSSAPTYIVIGDGGNIEGHASNYVQPQPEWSAYRNGTQYGYGILEIDDSIIQWSWYRNIDREFRSSDQVTIKLNT